MLDTSTQYHEIHIELIQLQAETLSEILLTIDGVLSISIEDANVGQPEEQALFGEPDDVISIHAWQRSLVKILIDSTIDPEDLIHTINSMLNSTPITHYQIHVIDDQDWVHASQAQFSPVLVGQYIWVVPSWHQIPKQANTIILRLDPGQAFGTGHHATTHLCLEWLSENPPIGIDVLDYGCGSGILAIAAHKLGAQQVSGVDIDPQAIITAQTNATQNQTEIVFSLPDALPEEQFDMIIANILCNPLKLMAGMLSNRVKINGHLVLSGILARQAEDVILSYAPWIKLKVWREKEGWVCLTGKKLSNSFKIR